MRVITGKARGRKLITLSGDDVRPTTDKVKESVFSIIQFQVEGRMFLDLFAGSGQMGIEALSRGAKGAYFFDMRKDAVAVVRKNLEALGLEADSQVRCGDALSLGEMDRLAQRFQETGDPALLQEIAAVAGKQKDARLAQIALLEKVKEPYLIPSHSRIQCGPMQYFADVEKYVTETPADKLQLDFSDMRHMASKRFLSLR